MSSFIGRTTTYRTKRCFVGIAPRLDSRPLRLPIFQSCSVPSLLTSHLPSFQPHRSAFSASLSSTPISLASTLLSFTGLPDRTPPGVPCPNPATMLPRLPSEKLPLLPSGGVVPVFPEPPLDTCWLKCGMFSGVGCSLPNPPPSALVSAFPALESA